MGCTQRMVREEVKNINALAILEVSEGWTNLNWRFAMGKVSHHTKKVYTIYALIDPRPSTEIHPVRYVGITYDVYQRMRQHSRCEGVNILKNAWVQELQRKQIMFIMHSIEQTDSIEKALERESYWIQHYLKLGAKLTNIAGAEENKPKRPVGPKWVISPTEASLLYFRNTSGQLVNVPVASHEDFDVFVQQYASITHEGNKGMFWDKFNRRNVLSQLIKNGFRPAICDAEGNYIVINVPV